MIRNKKGAFSWPLAIVLIVLILAVLYIISLMAVRSQNNKILNMGEQMMKADDANYEKWRSEHPEAR